jgi:hypothetical protein
MPGSPSRMCPASSPTRTLVIVNGAMVSNVFYGRSRRWDQDPLRGGKRGARAGSWPKHSVFRKSLRRRPAAPHASRGVRLPFRTRRWAAILAP